MGVFSRLNGQTCAPRFDVAGFQPVEAFVEKLVVEERCGFKTAL